MDEKIVGFDIDGVLSSFLGLKFLDWVPRKIRWFWDWLLHLPIGKFLYQGRQPNYPMLKVLKECREVGYQVILISFMWNVHRKEVVKWLERHDIAYDKLFLPEPHEDPVDFKARALKSARCESFIDDDPAIIRGLEPIVKTKIIHYRGEEKFVAEKLSLKGP